MEDRTPPSRPPTNCCCGRSSARPPGWHWWPSSAAISVAGPGPCRAATAGRGPWPTSRWAPMPSGLSVGRALLVALAAKARGLAASWVGLPDATRRPGPSRGALERRAGAGRRDRATDGSSAPPTIPRGVRAYVPADADEVARLTAGTRPLAPGLVPGAGRTDGLVVDDGNGVIGVAVVRRGGPQQRDAGDDAGRGRGRAVRGRRRTPSWPDVGERLHGRGGVARGPVRRRAPARAVTHRRGVEGGGDRSCAATAGRSTSGPSTGETATHSGPASGRSEVVVPTQPGEGEPSGQDRHPEGRRAGTGTPPGLPAPCPRRRRSSRR